MTYPGYDRFLDAGEGVSSKDLKERLALVSRVLADGGIIPWVFGHCAARIPGSNRIFIMPHAHWQGKVVQEVAAEDVQIIDLEGNVLNGDPIDVPEERFFYVEIFRARPDIGGVIYGHPNMSCAFAAAGRDTLGIFGDKVPLIPFPGFASVSETGEKVAKALGKGRAVVWSRGNVVVGKNIEEACVTAFALEREAERQLFVILLGGKPEPEPATAPPGIEDLASWMTKLGFSYFEAMDRGPRRETTGRLFWRSPGLP